MKYTDKDLAALISEIDETFSEHLAKAEQTKQETLAKSEEADAASKEAEDSKVEAQAEETQVQKSEDKTSDEFNYDEEDYKEMDEMYSSMSKSEAVAHLNSLKKALGDNVADAEVVEKTEKKEEKEEEVIAKSEDKVEDKEDNDETALLKSEVEATKKENEELKKSLEKLTGALTKWVKGAKAPKQKAITQIQYIKKSEDEAVEKTEDGVDVEKLSKKDISARLSAKIRSGKLEKAEREKITEYYDNGQTNLDSIKHLL